MQRVKRSDLSSSSSLQLGFLASHNGTDMKGIISALKSGDLKGDACVIISNNRDSLSLEYAREQQIPFYHLSEKQLGSAEELDKAIRDRLIEHGVNLVILSGYMKRVGPLTRGALPDRILNVHPALLPLHAGVYGDSVHGEVLDAGEKETGVTIHTIDEQYDKGRIIWQSKVQVCRGDTIELLRERVQAEEVRAFIEVLKNI